MGSDCGQNNDDLPYQPKIYKSDDEIPFAPDGNAPLICNSVEKVKGIFGPFQGLRCARKTLFVPLETDLALQASQRRKLVQEAKILHLARHSHVVQLFHTYFEEENNDRIKFAVVMDRGDVNLHDYLRPGTSPSTEWFGCLIRVVHHIHSLGIRHRDIKPSNILIKAGKILLADFGISQMGLGKTMPTTYENRNASRSREYCAPEVDSGSTRGRSADIFSLGAVFLEMLIATHYPDRFEDLKRILKPQSQHPSSYAKHIKEVHLWMQQISHLDDGSLFSWCRRMLRIERYNRPSAEVIESALSSGSILDAPITCQCAEETDLSLCSRLIEACKRGFDGEVRGFLNEGADPNTIGAIHFAAGRGSRLAVQTLLDAGALVDRRNPVGQTALQCAARNEFEDVVKELLDKNANVNAKDENDQTALHGAAGQGNKSIVKLLLDSNADVNAEDLDGQTAIQFAARRHHGAIVDLLKEYPKHHGTAHTERD